MTSGRTRNASEAWRTEARIPIGVEVHLEQWGDTVLLLDFDSGEHGD